MAAAQSCAAARVSNSAKHVAPDPDMRARSGAWASNASRTSAIRGSAATAGLCRSLRCRFSQAQNSAATGGGGSSGGLDFEAKCSNTRAVDNPRPGLTKHANSGGSAPKGEICAPMPCIKTGARPMQTGTSAPNDRRAATSGRGRSHSAAIACSVAAASALPPPMPEATGMVLCKDISV